MKYWLYVLFYMATTYAAQVFSVEYIYPIATLCSDPIVFLMHQNNRCESLQLLQWNYTINDTQAALWSLFNPLEMALLPDESGFSFIDNGRLRIQYFNKRSPKAIDFDHYFYDVTAVQWITASDLCCSAKMIDRYALIHGTLDGSSFCIVSSPVINYMYPQKIAEQLFFIAESYADGTNHPRYSIMVMDYPLQHDDIQKQPTTIMTMGTRPIAFLSMTSDYEGFFVSYPSDITASDVIVPFSYHHMHKYNDEWGSTTLFSFSIPATFLIPTSSEHLYESLAPLIPKVYGTRIYFIDASSDKDGQLEAFYYDMQKKVAVKNSHLKNNSFVPIINNGNLIAGGIDQQPYVIPLCFLT